jgi:hypothetical protein
MAEQNVGAPRAPIRFDQQQQPPAGAGAPEAPFAPIAGAMTCSKCATAIGAYYYEAGGAIFCARCKRATEESTVASGGFGRGALFGLGAALLGAFGYWAFIRITGIDWALVSIAVAAFVATAIRKGNGGRGSRRFQFLAVALTYLAIGGAYAPLFIEELNKQTEKGAAESPYAVEDVSSEAVPESPAALDSNALTSTGATVRDSLAKAAEARANRTSPGRGALLFVGAVLLLAVAGPVMSVMGGGFPGSLINLAIIGFALMRAWRMSGAEAGTTAGHVFTGPYRVGAKESAA